MMRILFGLAFAVSLSAAPVCTNISDVLYSITPVTPGPMSGIITVNLGYTISPVTQPGSARIVVSNGKVNTCLVPGNYTVTYLVKLPLPLSGNAPLFTRYWVI